MAVSTDIVHACCEPGVWNNLCLWSFTSYFLLHCAAWSSQWFNVDTSDVLLRLRCSIWPFFTHSFFETIGEAPDMYGPFWICATLVFVIGVAANLNTWIRIPDGEVTDAVAPCYSAALH